MEDDLAERGPELGGGGLKEIVTGWLNIISDVENGRPTDEIIDPQEQLGTTHRNKGVLVTKKNAKIVRENLEDMFRSVLNEE